MFSSGSTPVTHGHVAEAKSQQRDPAQIHCPTIDVLAKPRHERVFVVCIAADKKPGTQPEHLGSPKDGAYRERAFAMNQE
jgi:hypothetical protein